MTGTKETSVTRMGGEERRMQILNEAMRLFSDNGFRGTTTKEIARSAGISEAMVFRHFKNKNELYSAILDYKARHNGLENPFEYVAGQIAEKDDFGVFYGIALHALKHHREDRDFMRLLLYSALEGHELAKMFFDGYVEGMYEYLSGYIRKRQEDGAFIDIGAKSIVRAFIGMIIHHSLSNTLWDREQKILKISDEVAAKDFATVLLNGITT